MTPDEALAEIALSAYGLGVLALTMRLGWNAIRTGIWRKERL